MAALEQEQSENPKEEEKGSAFTVKAEVYFKFFTNEAFVFSCLVLSALQQMES